MQYLSCEILRPEIGAQDHGKKLYSGRESNRDESGKNGDSYHFSW